jgi:predicted RNA-binding Zn-ribbon protein involved in translation (DUF1610 family)
MSKIIHFQCRGCEAELETTPGQAERYSCPGCGERVHLRLTRAVRAGEAVDLCAGCGHPNLYIQKDFSRALGMTIVVFGVGICVVLFALDHPFMAMAALVGMAVVDTTIFVVVGSVTVCYACHTIYRGFPLNPEHEPFRLELLEQHGGKDARH